MWTAGVLRSLARRRAVSGIRSNPLGPKWDQWPPPTKSLASAKKRATRSLEYDKIRCHRNQSRRLRQCGGYSSTTPDNPPPTNNTPPRTVFEQLQTPAVYIATLVV